ncbi:alpha/beta fold hydrolase [Novosphingobium sp.]|uniref:alpha/beta fold hydrolase n=1 Tax=Novosphingobium sp. TaxID=1874826 RepID=UPI002733C53B|nr:alpha/beta hydrolase [Novosphingobium sp.]MDP3906662.1 alpha/beta hydrolase [Novosphingobium sp.]
MSDSAVLPDIGVSMDVGGIHTNYHESGDGDPVILLHGSGPGVTAWQNWHKILPRLGETHRVLALDVVGFGFSPLPEGEKPGIKLWTRHLAGFIDAMGLDRVTLIGNSFGGSLALGMMAHHAHKVRSLVLMGTPAGEFEQTQGLANSRSFEPSLDAMRAMMRAFPYDPSIVTDEAVEARLRVANIASGKETIKKLQPGDEQEAKGPRIVKGIPLQQLDAIDVPALILHGREDKMIPLSVAVRMHEHLKRSEMHVFGQCGHWVQLEREDQFLDQVRGFLRNN